MLDSICLFLVVVSALQTDRFLERYRAAGYFSLKYIQRIIRGIR